MFEHLPISIAIGSAIAVFAVLKPWWPSAATAGERRYAPVIEGTGSPVDGTSSAMLRLMRGS